MISMLEHLVVQAKNKYTSPKWRMRLCVSIRGLLCQITYTWIEEDMLVYAASAHKLPCLWRLVSKPHCSRVHWCGQVLWRPSEVQESGEEWNVESTGGQPAAFTCLSDAGLARLHWERGFWGEGGVVLSPTGTKWFPGYDWERKKFHVAVHDQHMGWMLIRNNYFNS